MGSTQVPFPGPRRHRPAECRIHPRLTPRGVARTASIRFD